MIRIRRVFKVSWRRYCEEHATAQTPKLVGGGLRGTGFQAIGVCGGGVRAGTGLMTVTSSPSERRLPENELHRKIGLLVVPGTIDAVLVPGSRRRPGMVASARVPPEEMVAIARRLVALPDLLVLPGPDRLSHHLNP